jgi:hypothetical protein
VGKSKLAGRETPLESLYKKIRILLEKRGITDAEN